MAQLSRIGKYEIRRELGRGAMGVVYEAYDPMIKRVVALKTIRGDQLDGDHAESVLARFRREAQAAGRLSHPNIVAVYDIGEDGGVWYIAMEFVTGRSLKDCFEANERFAAADIARIVAQILDALGYSHRQGVVHRDVKPANVILTAEGGVKVTDFGIAHVESSSMTQVGTVLGTPSYMSPEQIMGLPVDGRSDLFSAGVVLYQLLTGERPFSGSTTATMHKVLEEDPLPPSRFNVQIPGAMDAVVRKALAKRPDERFQSAAEFAAAMRDAVQVPDTPVEATLLAPPELAAPRAAAHDAPTADRGSAPSAPAAAPAQKSQASAIAIVAAVVIIAAGAGLWTFVQRGSGDAAKIAQAPAAPATLPAASAPTGAAPPAVPVAGMAAPTPPPASAAGAGAQPGRVTIAAAGLADPGDPRYAGDPALLQSELRADTRSQLVAKALGLMVEPASLAKNYDVVRDRLLAQSGNYIAAVVQESAPRLGKDGLMSMTAQAVVDVRALQQALNRMSRDERIEFIRASGDPRISVRIAVRDGGAAGATAQPSPVAENLLKERIKAFGFRTWSDGDGAPAGQTADFAVHGEVQVTRLSTRLEASGVVITKYALASWTVKCTDRATGEEIYFSTTLPKGGGSWASEGEAMRAIGARVADEFSRNFFLQHVTLTGRKVALVVAGMPDAAQDALADELVGLPVVLAVTPRAKAAPRVYDLQLAGSAPAPDLVAARVLKPLNAKLGAACFALGRSAGDEVHVDFAANCTDATVLSRLETQPPAALYGAPPSRQRALIRDPERLRQLSI